MRNLNLFVVSLALAGALVAGCEPKEDMAEKPKDGSTAISAESGTAAPVSEDSTGLSLDSVPESLRHEAFEYYGLANPNPLNLEISTGGETLTGTVRAELVSVEGDKAVFKIIRTGDLATVGNDTVEVTSEGIRAIETSFGEVKGEGLDMPASLESGDTWKVAHTIDAATGPLTDEITSKVVGMEKVQVKAGEYEALVIEQTGKVTNQDGTRDVESKWWYVKGRGPVKLEMTTKVNGEVAETITYEEVP